MPYNPYGMIPSGGIAQIWVYNNLNNMNSAAGLPKLMELTSLSYQVNSGYFHLVGNQWFIDRSGWYAMSSNIRVTTVAVPTYIEIYNRNNGLATFLGERYRPYAAVLNNKLFAFNIFPGLVGETLDSSYLCSTIATVAAHEGVVTLAALGVT